MNEGNSVFFNHDKIFFCPSNQKTACTCLNVPVKAQKAASDVNRVNRLVYLGTVSAAFPCFSKEVSLVYIHRLPISSHFSIIVMP
uniref:Ovule protein n=1 Tax=Steinernema glaseri TaxID=37863 RepID=A0A1I8A2Y0_9BILA